MRVIFLGSPASVIAPLETLLMLQEQGRVDIAGVVSQPARAVGRKGERIDPPLARYAKEQGLDVLQPEKASDPAFLNALRAWDCDVAITAAYGQILTDEFLAIPRRATINIHPSLLPAYRGATPVPQALLEGCHETGVTILFTVRKLDAGAIICQEKVAIEPNELADALTARLFRLGGTLLDQALDLLRNADFQGAPQDETRVTHCRKINKEDGRVVWSDAAPKILQRFRAYHPWPGTFTEFEGKRIVLEEIMPGGEHVLAPGAFRYDKAHKALIVGTGGGSLFVTLLKLEGSKSCDAQSFINGLRGRQEGQFT